MLSYLLWSAFFCFIWAQPVAERGQAFVAIVGAHRGGHNMQSDAVSVFGSFFQNLPTAWNLLPPGIFAFCFLYLERHGSFSSLQAFGSLRVVEEGEEPRGSFITTVTHFLTAAANSTLVLYIKLQRPSGKLLVTTGEMFPSETIPKEASSY